MAGTRAKFLRDSFAAHAERAANGYGGRPDFNSALALTLMQSGGQQSDVARIFSKLTPASKAWQQRAWARLPWAIATASPMSMI